MEFQYLFSTFDRLVTCPTEEVPDLMSSLFSLVSQKKGETVRGTLGDLTASEKYVVERLLKGLAGEDQAKINFAVCLIEALKRIKVEAVDICETFEKLVEGTSENKIKQGKILLVSCVHSAQKETGKGALEFLVECFGKENLREAAALALMGSPGLSRLFKRLPKATDVNYLMLSYSLLDNHDAVVLQAVQNKESILAGSFKVVPRVHPIWKLLLESTIQSSREAYLWGHFVEKEIGKEDKLKLKRISLAFGLIELCLPMKDISFVFSVKMTEAWMHNAQNKEITLHSRAIEMKEKLKKHIGQEGASHMKLFEELLNTLKDNKELGFLREIILVMINKCDAANLSQMIEKVKQLEPERHEPLITFFLSTVVNSKKADERTKISCLKQLISLLEFSGNPDIKQKILQSLKRVTLPSIESLVKSLLSVTKNSSVKNLYRKLKLLKFPTEDTDRPSVGKRERGTALLISESQFSSLKRLNYILLIETLFHSTEDSVELFSLLSSFASPPTPKLEKGLLDTTMKFFLSQLAKPAAYIRSEVNSAFASFAPLISTEFLDIISGIIATGDANLDVPGTEIQEEAVGSEPLSVLLEDTNNKKRDLQLKQIKSHFLIRSSDFIEILVANTQDFPVWCKLLFSLLQGLKVAYSSKKDPEFIQKYINLLAKFPKTKLLFPVDSAEKLSELATIMIQRVHKHKQLNKSFSDPIVFLLKSLAVVSYDSASSLVKFSLQKFFQTHNSGISVFSLKKCVFSVKPDESVIKKIFSYLKAGRTPTSSLQAIELLKDLSRKHPLSLSYTKKLLRIAKKNSVKDIKEKSKNKLLRGAFSLLLILFRQPGGPQSEEFAHFLSVQTGFQGSPVLSGILSQLTALR